eukprot:8174032-Pyramimonas_sp.AAC.1
MGPIPIPNPTEGPRVRPNGFRWPPPPWHLEGVRRALPPFLSPPGHVHPRSRPPRDSLTMHVHPNPHSLFLQPVRASVDVGC